MNLWIVFQVSQTVNLLSPSCVGAFADNLTDIVNTDLCLIVLHLLHVLNKQPQLNSYCLSTSLVKQLVQA